MKLKKMFSSQIELEFSKHEQEENNPYIRKVFLLSIALYALFGLFDRYYYPDNWKVLLIIRFAIVIPLLILVIFLTYKKSAFKYQQHFVAISFFVGGAGIAYMLVLNPENIVYYGGLFMVYFTGYLLVKLRFLYATFLGLSILFFHIIIHSILNNDYSVTFLLGMVFYIGANLIGSLGAYQIELVNRIKFLKDREILDINKRLNDHYQDKVEQLKQLEQSNKENSGLIFKNKELARLAQSLEESEQRFKILHNASFGGVAVHDKGVILECNKGLSDITGFSIDELVGMNGLLLIAPDFRDFVMEKITTGYEKSYEANGIRKNGEIYPVKLEARILPYKDKQVRVVEFRDITELKKQENDNKRIQDALIASEEQHRLLTAQMHLGLALHEVILDQKGQPIDYRFISINDSYERLTGLKREKIIGKTVLEVIPDLEKYWIDTFCNVALTGNSIQYENFVQALGKYYYTSVYSPKKGQFAVILDDITEKKEKEQQLIQKENEKTRIISNRPGVSYKCKFNDSWTMLVMSEVCESLTGYTTSELLYDSVISFNDLIVPKYRQYLMKQWIKSRELGQPCNVEYELVKKDGSIIWICEQGVTFFESDQWFIEGFLMDITDRKLSEEKMLYASEHDFLTDLHNRRYYFDQFKHLNQPQFYPLGLMMLDVNGLKIINDAFGHHAGDEALIMIGNMLKEVFEEKDSISRIGGDEFTVLLPNTNAETLQSYKEKLVEIVKSKPIHKIELSLAVGYELITNNHENIDEIQKNAENHMYGHKSVVGASVRSKAINAILVTLTDKYDTEKRHSLEVSHLCKQIGIELKLKEDELKGLEQAGLFHDIGKISIPDRILNKPGKLTDEEFDIIKTHTQIGYQILRAADEYSDLAIHALHHHERWDGKGYPSNLKGEDIPLFCRIINVIDAYEAMTADRPYRKKLSKEYAVSEIIKCAGTQFDPKIAQLFVEKVLKEKWNSDENI